MKWSFGRGSSTLVDLFTTFGGILILISLLFGDAMLFFASSIMLVLGLYPRWYLNYVASRLAFQNEKEKMYLSRGDQGELRLVFSNAAKLPIVYAIVEFSMDDHVHVGSINKWIGRQYQFEISLKANQKQTIILPIEALSRGAAKMKKLRVKIYDPLRLATADLTYDFIRKEVIIYPEKKPVRGLEQLMLPIEGFNPHHTSIYQDVTSPIGTREYVSSDPLKHVHWKASARTGQLQTKLFEKTMGMSWTIVILIDKEITKDMRAELEEQLSYAATICFEAEKRGVHTDICINTKPMGRSLVHRLEAGLDRRHLIKAMEFLALIQITQMKTLPLEALSEMDRGFKEPHVILVIDQARKTDKTRFYKKWQRNGHSVHIIDPAGLIVPAANGGIRVAR
ncbi:MAG: DUF58 domain-containing protein [Tuberibacillus sp.]